MQKKKLVAMVTAIALVGAVGIGSTLAYLSDTTDEVVNTVTVGTVGITLDESDVVYEDGTGYIASGDARVTENDYDLIVPGDSIYKDPVVHVASDSKECYVFMVADGLDDAVLNGFDFTIDSNWVKADGVDALDGVYVYASTLEAGDDTASFFADGNIDYGTDNTGMEDELTITVSAAAVQASHVDSAADAYDILF